MNITCYNCEHNPKENPCSTYKVKIKKAEDETDVYLMNHSCKVGCPQGYDKQGSPCYPTEETE